tara:strand:- start:31033 stop:31608 length:576 start_codon:yes stop_codon:yes gene_type:complete
MMSITRKSLSIFGVTFCGLLAIPSTLSADEASGSFASIFHEISIGVLHHDSDHLWSGFRRESGVDLNVEALFSPSIVVFGGDLRPALGVSINTSGDTSKAYLDARWRYDFENDIFVGIGVGAAVHNGETRLVRADKKALGSRVLFHIPLEAGYRFDAHTSVSLYFDHVSNAYLADANEGMDTLGVRVGYRF